MNRFDKVVVQAKEMFKDHVANYNEDGIVKVLEWGKPGTNNCRMNILFHKNFISISGDLREAVYDCTWTTELKNSVKSDFSYFTGKLSCVTDSRYEWRSDWCIEDIEKWYKETKEELEVDEWTDEELEEKLSKLNEFYEDIRDHTDNKYEYVSCIQDSNLDEFDESCESALWSAGERINGDLIVYWVALKMAYDQIYGKESH